MTDIKIDEHGEIPIIEESFKEWEEKFIQSICLATEIPRHDLMEPALMRAQNRHVSFARIWHHAERQRRKIFGPMGPIDPLRKK